MEYICNIISIFRPLHFSIYDLRLQEAKVIKVLRLKYIILREIVMEDI